MYFGATTLYTSTVKPLFIVFVGSLKKKQWIRENNRCGSLCKIGFAQEPQKLNDGSGKTSYRGTIDRGFTVFEIILHLQTRISFTPQNNVLQ
jgi:hypothetical protein